MTSCRECGTEDNLCRVVLNANREAHVPNYFTVCHNCLGDFISENRFKFKKAERIEI